MLRAPVFCLVVFLGFSNLRMAAGSQATGTHKADAAPFTLKISAGNSSIKAGAAVWVDATVTNTSSHSISVSGSVEKAGFEYSIEVRNEHAAEAPKTRLGQELSGQAKPAGGGLPETVVVEDFGYRTLAPGKSLTDRVEATKLYDFTEAGKYTIQFTRFDDQTKSLVKSNTITITID